MHIHIPDWLYIVATIWLVCFVLEQKLSAINKSLENVVDAIHREREELSEVVARTASFRQ